MYKGASRIYPAYTRGWGAPGAVAGSLTRRAGLRGLQIEKTSISAKTLVLEFRYLKHPWTSSRCVRVRMTSAGAQVRRR